MIAFYALLFVIVTAYRFLPSNSPQVSETSDVLRKYISSALDSPYHVLIVYSNLYCSGALVRSKVVVTVASCMTVREPTNAVVKIGSDTIVGYGQIVPVIEVKIHEYFKHLSRMDNDIAVLVLQDHVSMGPTAKKIIIVEPEVALRIGTTLGVTGWGGPERKLGDNGGPAVFKDLLVGLVSFGAENKNEPYIAVLTNVSYFHRWIILNSSRLLKKYCVPKHVKDLEDTHHHQDVA